MMMNMKTALLKAEAVTILTPVSKTTQTADRVLQLYAKCKELVTKLGRWLRSSPPQWQATVVSSAGGHTHDASGPPVGSIITFPSIWVAGARMNCSASRILLLGIMVRCLRWMSDSPWGSADTSEYTETVETGEEEVRTIIMSVPYFLNWTEEGTTAFPCVNSTTPKSLAGLTCLWPLAIASFSEFITLDQREYLRHRLWGFYEATGSRHAECFLEAMVDRPRL